jgi:hypothetical protein
MAESNLMTSQALACCVMERYLKEEAYDSFQKRQWFTRSVCCGCDKIANRVATFFAP